MFHGMTKTGQIHKINSLTHCESLTERLVNPYLTCESIHESMGHNSLTHDSLVQRLVIVDKMT